MQTGNMDVFNNIDTLIAMSGSALDLDEMNSELIALRKQMKNKKGEIEDLKGLMNDARYFNASNELVDKNIEISLKNKISRLNRKIKDIETSIEEIKTDEKTLHDAITELKTKISENENYIEIIKEKVTSSSNNKFYTELLKKEEKNNKALSADLDKKQKEYEEVLKALDLNNQAHEELKTKLEQEKTRLNDILDNLKNPNAYIDEDLKTSDEAKLNKLEDELAKLEKRELELLTDARIIGTDAKELIAKNEYEEAINKMKELVTIVKSKPYMEVTSRAILEEELEKKEAARVELSNLIDSKNYEELNSGTILDRMNYINEELEENTRKSNLYRTEINKIDEFINSILGPKIEELETNILKKVEVINEYRSLAKDKDKSVKTRANTENAIEKKEKEKKILDGLLASYKSDLLSKIEESNVLKKLVDKLNEEASNNQKETTELKKLSMLDFKTRDLIEEEKDKEELKALNEEIKALKSRMSFDKSPDEIYDEIEMSIGSLIPIETRETKNKNKGLEIDNLFDETKSFKPITPETKSIPIEPPRLKVVSMIPVETVRKSGGAS